MFRRINTWCIGVLAAVILTGTSEAHAQGDALFKSKCATCHQPHKNSTGPKLFEVRKKWDEAGELDLITDWVQNNAALRASGKSKRATAVYTEYKGAVMTAFPELTKEQVISILDWVDAQPDPAAAGAEEGAAGGAGIVAEEVEEGSNTWVWVVLALVFAVIIAAVSGVRRQLKSAINEDQGEDDKSYAQEFRSWAWVNKKYLGMFGLVVVVALLVAGIQDLGRLGVLEEYQPSQPIEFPHDIHAGVNGIDCKYCHNSVTKSKTAGIPSVNVCMNCHKQVNGRTPEQQEKIKAIYEAAGWDPSAGGAGAYTGKTKPIIWNKVHVLPDHVYFNHSQHVVVGGVDCKQCHGDMTKQKETARVLPVAELNKVEGNVVLSRPTLTMGWCIECHDQKEIHAGPLDGKGDGYYNEIHKRLLRNDRKLYRQYLDDGKVTVKELGGWECAKCHY